MAPCRLNNTAFRAIKTHMKHTLFLLLLMTDSLLVAGACYARGTPEQTYSGRLIFLDDGAFFRADGGTPGSLPVKTCSSTNAFSALAATEIGQVWSVRFEGHPMADDQGQTLQTRCIIHITRFNEAKQ